MRFSNKASFFLLQLAPLGLAAPAEGRASKVDQLDKTWKDYSWQELCNKYNPEGNNDPSLAEPLWTDVGVGKWFDSWLANTPDKAKWTQTMDIEVNKNGASGLRCDKLDQPCPTPDDCKFHYDQNMGPAYWVLYSSARLHEALRYLKSELTEGSYNATLNVDKMVENFGFGDGSGSDSNALAVMNGAFTVAAGAVTALTGPLTIIAGVFGLAAAFAGSEGPPPPDPATSLKQQTNDAFSSAIVAVEQITEQIFFSDSEGDNENLPFLEGDYAHSLARFYAEGKFLGKGIVDDIEGVKDEYIRRHQQALSAHIIAQMGFVVTVAHNINNADDCKGPALVSTWFHEPSARCFRVMKKAESSICAQAPSLKMVDGPVSVAISSYGLEMGDFYTSSYDCADQNRDGGGKVPNDAAKIPTDGSLPPCFFNVPVVSGTIEARDTFAYIKDMDINTAGFSTEYCDEDGDGQGPHDPPRPDNPFNPDINI